MAPETRKGCFSMPTSSSERVLQARLAAHTRWAQEQDRVACTAPARSAFLDRFNREVDPDGKLSPVERARRAENARKAYFADLALRSIKARRLAAEARKNKGKPQPPPEQEQPWRQTLSSVLDAPENQAKLDELATILDP